MKKMKKKEIQNLNLKLSAPYFKQKYILLLTTKLEEISMVFFHISYQVLKAFTSTIRIMSLSRQTL